MTNVESLFKLNQEFADWRDPLSKKLHAWLVASGTQKKLSKSSIADLRLLLLDPLTAQPLREPWIERAKWIWEKSVLQEWIAPSPHDGEPVIDCKPHLFAQRVIVWISDQVEKREPSSTEESNSNDRSAVKFRTEAVALKMVKTVSELTQQLDCFRMECESGSRFADLAPKVKLNSEEVERLYRERSGDRQRVQAHLDEEDAKYRQQIILELDRIENLERGVAQLQARIQGAKR